MNERYIPTNQENFSKVEKQNFLRTENEGLFRLTLRGKIALTAAALVIGVLVAKELSGTNEAPITTADPVTITVNSGVNLHTSPHMISDSADGNTNIDYTVPNGKKIVVHNPLSATTFGSTGEEQWEGFHVSGVNGIQWINESQLMNHVNQGAIDVKYNSNPDDSINVTGDGNGNYTFKTPDGSEHTAGTSEIISSNP